MDRRRPITLLAALILALALCAPAWAQDETDGQAGADEPAVEAQGAGGGSGSGSGGTDDSGAEVSGSGSGGGSDANNGLDDLNCEDFDFQEDAQDFFDRQGGRDGGDEDRLDEDPGPDDGDACEDLPSRDSGGGGDSGTTPSGGVDSGAGGTAPIDEPAWLDSLPVAVVGGLVTVLLLGVRAVRRRP